MNENNVYLDTSSIIKRYVEERGSRVVDHIYSRAEAGELTTVTSLWNIGEVLGVLDKYRSRGLIGDRALQDSLKHFLGESQKMIRLESMQIPPLTADILVQTYSLIFKHHVYQADALQIATCRTSNCKLLVSADHSLLTVAKRESMSAFDVETQEDEIKKHL